MLQHESFELKLRFVFHCFVGGKDLFRRLLRRTVHKGFSIREDLCHLNIDKQLPPTLCRRQEGMGFSSWLCGILFGTSLCVFGLAGGQCE